MALQPFFILVRPHEVNGCLQAQGNKLLIIVPNYTRLFVEPPKTSDDSDQVFLVGVPEDELRVISESGVDVPYLWKGDPMARSKPSDKGTLEILSLMPFTQLGAPAGAGAPAMDPVQAAGVALANMPSSVRIAAVIGAAEEKDILLLPDMSPARAAAAKAWANATVAEYVQSQQPAAPQG